MTDFETAIMIKNIARETVRRMTAKNALKAYKVIGKTSKQGREFTWIRFANDLSSAIESAKKAIENEFPGQGILKSVTETADPRG